MSSSNATGPVSQQYAAAATVPLIKSPSLWLPKPIELPNDIHPLPEDITAYFVYPFSLETHVLSLQPSPHEAISQRRARNAAILHQREVEEEQKERDALHRIAPGYKPTSVLVPQSATAAQAASKSNDTDLLDSLGSSTDAANGKPTSSNSGPVDLMDDLVNQLEALESRR